MTVIKQKDFEDSIASALQYISYYHSEDFILAMTKAYELEQSSPAKDEIRSQTVLLTAAPACPTSRRSSHSKA